MQDGAGWRGPAGKREKVSYFRNECAAIESGIAMQIFPSLAHPVWFAPALLVGACIGSFLNVVIHRVPLGLSVNEPKRSFCPKCKASIPMRLNIPLVSWLWLRGKCANCKAPIAFRYFAVELLTALWFAATWGFVVDGLALGAVLRPELVVILPLWIMAALFMAIVFIDAEHMIIPLSFTTASSLAGLAAAALWPRLPDLAGWFPGDPTAVGGIKHAVIGWIIGFCGLWVVVRLGKMAFGNRRMEFGDPVEWRLIEPAGDDEPIWFEMNGERTGWWDMFFRKTDRLVIEATEVSLNGEKIAAGVVTIRETSVELPGGRTVGIEEIQSLDGKAPRAVIPREAMGMGDVHLLGSIGAFFGWTGVFFSLFSASIYAIVAAVLGRIGFGRRLPFGPFLILGALTWMFGGWKVARWYFDLLAGGL